MGGLFNTIIISRREEAIYVISEAAITIDQYSASTLDRATVGCFLVFQETYFDPINIQYPEVECRVPGKLILSASEKP